MSETTKFCLWCATFAALTMLVFLAYCGRVNAQTHDHHHHATADDPLGTGHTHQGDVGQFYQSWKRPNMRDAQGQRYSSCCGGQDCRPIMQVRKHPSGFLYLPTMPDAPTVPATWEVYVQNFSGGMSWYTVPDYFWEDAQLDPIESPDERGHVCITYSGFVICAVRASGQ